MLISFLWFTTSLVALVFAQRWMHTGLQRVLLLLFRKIEIAFFFYALLLLPGVVLHEASHLLAARLLRVRTRSFSMIPKMRYDGTIRFGYVETDRVGHVRSALIGAAPLASGILVLALLVYGNLGWSSIGMDGEAFTLETLPLYWERLIETPNLGWWLYLAIVVSNTMLPSSADRAAWIPLGLILGALVGFIVLLGFGPQAADLVAEPAEAGLRVLAGLFTLTTLLDLVLVLPLWLVQSLVG
ncbi:MAG TPA: hypothetical protein G4O08_04975 [Anaerolineae bacterium]|nr:hypothetical protein [Anaerolineae bacterium]